ncbi:MAG: DUF423 domain-containing protein [Xanthobacteraceae bacterium]
MILLIAFAGLMGAAGVALLAASAHAAPGTGLDGAGQILLFHAAALIALMAAGHGGLLTRPLALIAGAGLVIGATLFSGDIAARAFLGHRLFPMAAPTGGVVLIASWLAVTVAAAVSALR